MDDWRETAAAAIDDIETWRGIEEQRPNTPTTWWQEEPDVFFNQTAAIVAWITNRHPSIDVKPFTDIHEVVHRWCAEHSASNLVTHGTLARWMDRAILGMTVARQAIFAHAVPTAQAGKAEPQRPHA